MRKNIVYIPMWSPWKSAGIKVWLHHNLMMENLKDYQFHCGIPMQGASYYEGLLNGNRNRLMNEIKDLDITFPTLEGYKGGIDGMLIEVSSVLEIETFGGTLSEVDVINMIDAQVDKAMENNAPIILYDGDAYYVEGRPTSFSKEAVSGDNYGRKLFDRIFESYDNCYLLTPMAKYPYKGENSHKIFYVPFNYDPDRCPNEITPLSSRSSMMKYVGNNYLRDSYLDIFKTCSEFGTVEVYGSGWSDAKRLLAESNPRIEFKGKVSMTTERLIDEYSDCRFGVYGGPEKWVPYEHCTLRIREYLYAGLFIIPENTHLAKLVCLPDFWLTVDDINSDNENFNTLLNLSDERYERLVKLQRDHIEKHFSYKNYIDIYKNIFGGTV